MKRYGKVIDINFEKNTLVVEDGHSKQFLASYRKLSMNHLHHYIEFTTNLDSKGSVVVTSLVFPKSKQRVELIKSKFQMLKNQLELPFSA
ncbi:hypothetical protein HBN50_01625 [Halobacteriovorax sp. GB3]|uniref:hypothetical protein n=1 Tax=Halobacteriovorax sp. GB3 TaxID=2719615 RepID=UPI0023601DD7|nr:hypothetical protein [Halobacteriovorax sp. GB3]MDD0851769.1 hypothetical protein [Halobacteriovorax sp. GB3]